MKTKIWFVCFSVLLMVLMVSACSPENRAGKTNCNVNMEKLVTINVTDVSPRVIFDQLEKDLDCNITIFPGIYKHVTLKLNNATVNEVLADVCGKQIQCQFTYNGGRLSIAPRTFIQNMRIRAQEKWFQKFEVHLPDGMQFENAPLTTVLADISKASGLDIKPWAGEGDRLVTADLSGMTVEEGLSVVVRQVSSEGVVMVKMWSRNSYAQHRLVDK